ncbi:MAG: ankyrin repeat domain-containing protein, partial [Desulfovibrionaceae bacterium]|nr:ankyrin repeat domain-containing protein [Desulfovibrionaceae bacterium]
LLEAGADLNARDTQGWTPIHWAAISGKSEAVKLLLVKGAQFTPEDFAEFARVHLSQDAIFRLLEEASKR